MSCLKIDRAHCRHARKLVDFCWPVRVLAIVELANTVPEGFFFFLPEVDRVDSKSFAAPSRLRADLAARVATRPWVAVGVHDFGSAHDYGLCVLLC